MFTHFDLCGKFPTSYNNSGVNSFIAHLSGHRSYGQCPNAWGMAALIGKCPDTGC